MTKSQDQEVELSRVNVPVIMKDMIKRAAQREDLTMAQWRRRAYAAALAAQAQTGVGWPAQEER